LGFDSGGTFLEEPFVIGKGRRIALPVMFGPGRSNLMSILNFSDQVSTVKAKLILGRRSPEVEIVLPANGVRLLHLESNFYDFITLTDKIRGYLRVTVRRGGDCGVQLLEESKSLESKPIYRAVG